jgi:hypothetical protein
MSTDVKYVVTVDSTGAQKSIETLDQALAKLRGETKDTGLAAGDLGQKSESLWQQFAIGQMVVNALRQAWGLLKGQVSEAIGAAGAAEKADRSLDASLGLTGRDVQALSGHFKTYANELMGVTIYDDEVIKSSQALLIQLTDLDQRGIDRATKGAIGLASVFGMDLVSASTLVAKAMTGNMAALSRYGIKVDENLSLEQKRVVLLDKLEKMFGRATTDAEVYTGRVAQLKNVWGEAQEEIGKAVTQNEKVAGTFKAIRDTIVIITPDLKAMLKDVSTFVLDVAKAATDAILWLKRVRDSIGESGAEVSASELAWDNLSKRMGGFTGVAQAVVAQLNRVQQYSKDNTGVNRELWESFNTIGERATLAAIAVGKFGPEVAAAFAVVGGETLKVALAAAKGEEGITGLGNAAVVAAPKMTLLNTAIDAMPWGKHRAELMAAEAWLRSTTTLIEGQLPAVAGYSSNVDKAADRVEILRRALEGLNKTAGQTKWDKFAANMTQAVGLVSAAWSGFSNQATTNATIALDNEYKKRLAIIEATVKDEEKKQAAIVALEAEYQIKRQDAARKGAVITKAINMMEAVTNAYAGASRAYKDFPFPASVIISGIVMGLGLAQVALIAKQPIPLAKGAVFSKPTLLPAVTYQVGDAGPGNPEIIAPKSTIRDAVREAMGQMLPQMALAGGGGATVSVYLTGPLITTTGLSRRDIHAAGEMLVDEIRTQLGSRSGRKL